VKNVWREFKGSVFVDSLIGIYGFVDIEALGGNWADVLISDFMVEKGNKPSEWTLAIGDINQSINVAKQAADNAQSTANIANSSVSTLNTYVDGSFKDGVISQSEAQSIEKYKNQVTKDFNDLIAGYNIIYANTYLIGSAKTDLLNAKVTMSGAKDNLLTSINTAIADGKTTVLEKEDVDSKYSAWDSSYSTYKSKLELANKAIQSNLESLAQTAASNAQSNAITTASADAAAKVNNLQIGGRNLFKGTNHNYECISVWGGWVIESKYIYITNSYYNACRSVNVDSTTNKLFTLSFMAVVYMPYYNLEIENPLTNATIIGNSLFVVESTFTDLHAL